ncbi:MAG TPA: uroporphyrinogen-III synthase [Quisquiliibacterium sp.]|nr:uroporphyrinogen-III synthase [Quisquiliibacterium sp.]
MTRVVLTQPAPRASALANRLRARGHEVVPIISRRLVRCAQAPRPAEFVASLPGACDWVVFVSPGSIGIALEDDDEAVPPWPADVGIAVVGPGSAQALAELGIGPPRVRVVVPGAAPYDAAALLATAPFDAPAGLRVLVVHGERARTDWHEALRQRGAVVRGLAVYRSEPVRADSATVGQLRDWCVAGAPAVFVFTSVDAVLDCDALLAAESLDGWARAQPALAVHPRIVAALAQRGWEAARLIEPGEPALLAGIESS